MGEQLRETIYEMQQRDAFARKRLDIASHDTRTTRSGDAQLWRKDEDGLLRRKGRLYIPCEESFRAELLRKCHDDPMAGHYGALRTQELLSRHYWWPDMEKHVRNYVSTCAIC